jgi:hypothetical protein
MASVKDGIALQADYSFVNRAKLYFSLITVRLHITTRNFDYGGRYSIPRQSFLDLCWVDTIELNWKSEMGRAYNTYGKQKCCIEGSPEGKSPLGRPRRRWEDNIKLYLQEVGYGHGLDSSGAVYRQGEGACEGGNEISDYTKCGEFLG